MTMFAAVLTDCAWKTRDSRKEITPNTIRIKGFHFLVVNEGRGTKSIGNTLKEILDELESQNLRTIDSVFMNSFFVPRIRADMLVHHCSFEGTIYKIISPSGYLHPLHMEDCIGAGILIPVQRIRKKRAA